MSVSFANVCPKNFSKYLTSNSLKGSSAPFGHYQLTQLNPERSCKMTVYASHCYPSFVNIQGDNANACFHAGHFHFIEI